MSEPSLPPIDPREQRRMREGYVSTASLRSTIADTVRPALAAAHFYGATDTQALNAADAVLRVIHTQRDAIARTLYEHRAGSVWLEWFPWDGSDQIEGDEGKLRREQMRELADAVLATLGAEAIAEQPKHRDPGVYETSGKHVYEEDQHGDS